MVGRETSIATVDGNHGQSLAKFLPVVRVVLCGCTMYLGIGSCQPSEDPNLPNKVSPAVVL